MVNRIKKSFKIKKGLLVFFSSAKKKVIHFRKLGFHSFSIFSETVLCLILSMWPCSTAKVTTVDCGENPWFRPEVLTQNLLVSHRRRK